MIIATVLGLTRISAQSFSVDSTERLLLDKEYQLWHSQSDSARVCLLTEKAFIYRQQRKFNQAVQEIERGVTYVNDTSVVSFKWKYEAVINYYLVNKFEKASSILENFSAFQAKDIHKQKEYLYVRWSVYAETNQLEKCRDEMLALTCSLDDTLLANEIKKLPIAGRIKNSQKARRLSAFIPGLGSVYAGYPLKGATSFMIDATLLSLTIVLAVNHLYVTAFVSGFMPLVKFYKGNIKLADHLADKRSMRNNFRLKQLYHQKISAITLKIKE